MPSTRFSRTRNVYVAFMAAVAAACSAPLGSDGPIVANGRKTLTVAVEPAGGGTVGASPSKAAYLKGEKVELAASPAAGYYFSSWSGDASGTSPTAAVVMGDNRSVTAVFKARPRVEIEVYPPDGGSVAIDPAASDFLPGDTVRLAARAAAEHDFDHWEGDLAGAKTEETLAVPEAGAKVRAIFRPYVYHRLTCAPSPAAGGSVVLDPPGGVYRPGVSVSLAAVAAPGYEFGRWTGAAAGTDPKAVVPMDADKQIGAEFRRREWTMLLYMAADNDLYGHVGADLNALEAADLKSAGVCVLALVDTPSGASLYRIERDPNGINAALVSPRLGSVDLGTGTDAPVPLNSGDPAVLRSFSKFAFDSYPAERYGLIVWGHGSGWRGSAASPARTAATEAKPPIDASSSRVVAFDDGARDGLHTQELASALAYLQEREGGRTWDFVGLETCNGMSIEIAYQLRARAGLLAGSCDLIPKEGWDYADWTAEFLASADRGPRALAAAIASSFARTYANQDRATFSVVDLSRIGAVHEAWNQWSQAVSATITAAASRDAVRAVLVNAAEDYYVQGGDLNIDMRDAAVKMLDGRPSLRPTTDALLAGLDAAVVSRFASPQGNPRSGGLAVHLAPLDFSGSVRLPHDDAYFRGKGAAYPLDFVESSAWPPSKDGGGLLFKIFYQEMK